MKTIKFRPLFLCYNPQRSSRFSRFISFYRNGTLKNKKTEKWIVKTIKCIYSEPGILILSGVPFNFYLINLFQTILDQRTTILNVPAQFEQVDTTCGLGGGVFALKALIWQYLWNVANETQKSKPHQIKAENVKNRRFEPECLISYRQWNFPPFDIVSDFSMYNEAF